MEEVVVVPMQELKHHAKIPRSFGVLGFVRMGHGPVRHHGLGTTA